MLSLLIRRILYYSGKVGVDNDVAHFFGTSTTSAVEFYPETRTNT